MIWQTKTVQVETTDKRWDSTEETYNEFKKFVPSEYLKLTVYETFPAQWDLKVYNVLEKQWINVLHGHWIIKGLKGEFYPCQPDALEAKYFQVDEDSEAISLVELVEVLRAEGEELTGDNYIKESDLAGIGETLIAFANQLEKYGIK